MKLPPPLEEWRRPLESELASVVEKMTADNLEVYTAQPMLIDEHAGSESNLAHGGYGRRQLQELIQNGADQLLDRNAARTDGRVHVVLTDSALYCANEGDPITKEGIEALLLAHVSPKRGAEIGRFGLGFKSVLGISTQPQLFSRNVSFGFDGKWAKELIETRHPGYESYPVLRVAQVLDPKVEAIDDQVLGELMNWATAVVRVPLDLDHHWLADDLESFPAEFLLFSPHVGRLILEDRSDGFCREITSHTTGSVTTLQEADRAHRWQTFNHTMRPSSEAKSGAGSHNLRDDLPVIWAVPLDGPITAGRFWAFFPLRDETTLSGIINAPWQINDDRTGLLEGSALNGELIDAVLDIVEAGIPALVDPSDPARILELIPARGREARCWGDDLLTRRFQQRERMKLVPDQDGVLHAASDVQIPDLSVPMGAAEIWSSSPNRPTDWLHPSAFTNATRRHRIERLLEGTRTEPVPPNRWLEALVDDDPSPETSAVAIRAAAAIAADPAAWTSLESNVRSAEIVECSDETFTMIDPDWVWLPDASSHREPLLKTVHPAIVARADASAALELLNIRTLTSLDELRVWIEDSSTGDDWVTMWDIVREIDDPSGAARVLRDGAPADCYFRVMTASGDFRPFNEVLLPGPIIPITSEADDVIKVDMGFHASDIDVLEAAGVVNGPVASYPVSHDSLARSYSATLIDRYLAGLKKSGASPKRDQLEVHAEPEPGPLAVLPLLSEEAKARFTTAIFEVSDAFPEWKVSHRSFAKYPEVGYESCALDAVRRYGILPTSLGSFSAGCAVGPRLNAFSDVLPVCTLPGAACTQLRLPSDIDELEEPHWRAAMSHASDSTDDSRIGKMYALASQAGIAPPRSVRCRQGSIHVSLPPGEVACTSRREHFDALARSGSPVILAPDEVVAEALVVRWCFLDASKIVDVTPEVISAGPVSPLVDLFPALKDDLKAKGVEGVQLIPCAEIEVVSSTPLGTESSSKSFHFDWETSKIYYLAEDGIESALREIDSELHLDLDEDEIISLTSQGWKRDLRARTRKIRLQNSDAARLLEAVGPEAIQRLLPVDLVKSLTDFGETVDAPRAAELFLQVKGFDALKELRSELEANHLNPPMQWAGSTAARNYVQDLGFSVEFAGVPARRRESVLSVSGPMVLPELHDYQRDTANEIRRLLRSEIGEKRGLLSLPTGAGKTRVAVQALTEAVTDGDIGSPIIWLAQSDELCEQAVQAWAQVWRFKGRQDEELTISRLWGENEAQEETEGAQVVIATPDKLGNRISDDSYDWMTRSSCVVIDEAHTAIASSYTKILEWLGIGQRGRVRTRCPLIGLSATPFRGSSASETERLASRFGRLRLDIGMGDDPYDKLQKEGILSRVEAEALEGAEIQVNPETTEHFGKFKDVPRGFFNALGTDTERNRRIVDSIEGKPPDWPVLLFAASRTHAHTIAALLAIRGIPSVAIDSETDMGLRRRYIDEFKAGGIKVMCNYMVFSQGFDAPSVRAVYITRPTFSPNAYQQMIGRGLRGPKNGGEEVCLIVNVLDNWSRFGDQLAYREFEHLWTRADS